jgi:hypothetical protein
MVLLYINIKKLLNMLVCRCEEKMLWSMKLLGLVIQFYYLIVNLSNRFVRLLEDP